ncbi:hypothetical protein PBRA_007347 [Plasmodiophora brassicae]|uniref:Glycoside-hydrolase family GH114 TIM-barrel domain-containing protein n=1 Tax=Plasmodiophora brassicae TaxID=37360 RepID=A0A0G4IWZ5_PLABS|nr:hypothetical protein PBRA_007347 [Plasmodiophora brassicae]
MSIARALTIAAAALYGFAHVEAAWTRPQVGMAWQWELTSEGVPDVTTPNVPVWDIDPEALDVGEIPTLMNALHANDRYIICYVNVGSLEPDRMDVNAFKSVSPTIIGDKYPGWDEQFLDIRRSETRSLMKARFQRMASYGCHGIEPDNLDTYLQITGFSLSPADALDYMNWIASTVHGLGMAVGLKNCGDLIAKNNLADVFDYAIVENCAAKGNCPDFAPFIQAGRPVFAAEYTDAGAGGCNPTISSVPAACAVTNAQNLEAIIKSCNLGPEWQPCQTYSNTGYRSVATTTTPNATPTPSPTSLPTPALELSFSDIPDVTTPDVPVWDIDPEQLDQDQIPALMDALRSSNRYIICYVNVGSLDASAVDAGAFQDIEPSIVGNPYPNWPAESFLDIRREETRSLMKARFQRMASYGCQGIDADNVDSYTHETGLGLDVSDALDYMNWIVDTVHGLGMSIGLKNSADLVAPNHLAASFDFAVVEACAETGDCPKFDPFIQAGKPVFAVEYTNSGRSGGCNPKVSSVANACAVTNAHDFEGIIKSCDLRAEWSSCQSYDRSGYRSVSTPVPSHDTDANPHGHCGTNTGTDTCAHLGTDPQTYPFAIAGTDTCSDTGNTDAYSGTVRRRRGLALLESTRPLLSIICEEPRMAALYGFAHVEAAWTRPQIGMGWQWELTVEGVPDVTTPNVPVWDIDPEALDVGEIPTLMNALHANDRYIICYVNVGSLEPDRMDVGAFTSVSPTIIGGKYPGWNEQFLDIRRSETRSLMKARFQRMASYGCHGIEPDNLDTYTAETGFSLSAADALDYMNWIASTVHGLGMAVGLKNCGDLIAKNNLADVFDYAIVENCAAKGNCPDFAPFIQAGRPVFAAEYTDAGAGGCSPTISSVPAACAVTNAQNLEAIIKSCDLGPEWQPCQTYSNTGYRSWELSLEGVPDVTTPNVPVWDIDPEALDVGEIPTLMNALHANDRYIICYVNVGSLEPDRMDVGAFTSVSPTIIGGKYPGWNEQFLDIRRSETRSLMKARFQRMASYGCHGIEPDNLDTYTAETGFSLSAADALDYMNWIASTVHGLGMAVGLKNCGDLIAKNNLADVFDFAIVENCAETGDCPKFAPFIQAGKPVFAAEYTDAGAGGCNPTISSVAAACAVTNAQNLEAIIKSCDLGPEWQPCQTYSKTGYRSTACGTDSQTDSGTDSQIDYYTYSRTDSRTDSQIVCGTDSQTHSGTDSQIVCGTDSQTHSGTDSHTNAGTDSQVDTGSNSKTNAGADSQATNPGTDSGTDTCASLELSFGDIPDLTTPDVPVWDIDPEQLDQDQIPALMDGLRSSNRYIICYVNVGSLDASAVDAGAFQDIEPSIVGNPYPNWPAESFLDIRREETRSLMKARFQRMASYGCQGIDADNVDSYSYKTGLGLDVSDALDYMNWIVDTVHGLGMSIGLKNSADLVAPNHLAASFDFAVVEACAETGDCPKFDPFIQAGKPVFAVEYTNSGRSGGCNPKVSSVAHACAVTNAHDFEGIIKSCDLRAEWSSCQSYDRSGYRSVSTPVPSHDTDANPHGHSSTDSQTHPFADAGTDTCSNTCNTNAHSGTV